MEVCMLYVELMCFVVYCFDECDVFVWIVVV